MGYSASGWVVIVVVVVVVVLLLQRVVARLLRCWVVLCWACCLVLYCLVLYCLVLYCLVLYCLVLCTAAPRDSMRCGAVQCVQCEQYSACSASSTLHHRQHPHHHRHQRLRHRAYNPSTQALDSSPPLFFGSTPPTTLRGSELNLQPRSTLHSSEYDHHDIPQQNHNPSRQNHIHHDIPHNTPPN